MYFRSVETTSRMRILVTTDFSPNSKAAIKYAAKMAGQIPGSEIIFYHTVQVMKPTQWSDVHFKKYLTGEIQRLTKELERFTDKAIPGKSKSKFKKTFLIENSLSTGKAIMDAAKKRKCDFICIATRGAGMLKKFIGTHTEYLVNNSPIPVCAVPSTYKIKDITRISYLSDFAQIKKEMTQVARLNEKLKASLEIIHFSLVNLEKFDIEKASRILSADLFAGVKLTVEENDIRLSLVEKINRYAEQHKPHLLIMFTKRNKGFFESLFLPSKSAELTFTTKVPVLILPK